MGLDKSSPPKWADRFLEWYCRPELLEEIQGDIHEIFYRAEARHRGMANLGFVWNVFRFFRWNNIKRNNKYYPTPLASAAMFKNYFISGLRNIARNMVPSSINIIGLSIALACGLSVFLLLDSYYNRDTFHEKGSRLYMLMNKMKAGDEIDSWARTPYLLGPSLKDEHRAIESIVRIQQDQLSVRHGEVVFREQVWFVDPEFLHAFSYPLLHGQPDALSGKNNIVLTGDMAIKYFGRTDVVGEDISIKFPREEKLSFTITGVLKRVPDNSSMHISFLIPMQVWEQHVDAARNIQWRTWAASTFAVFREGHRPEELNAAIEKYKKIQHQANDKFQIQEVEWIPIDQVAERSYNISYSLSWSNLPAAMVILGMLAGFLVLLACFNYMNVAVASVSTRLKEIGIRKMIGGGKRQIIQQFIIENIVLCSFAMIVGTGIAYFLLLPGFNTLYPIHIPFEFSSASAMLGFFGGGLLLVALISGAYPALYVSSFNPVRVLKGNEKFGSKGLLSKILLCAQFVISFSTIVACLVFINSSSYFEGKDWGYNHNQHLFVAVKNSEQYNALKDRVAHHQHVVSYAGAESHIGHASHSTTVNVLDQQINVIRLEVGFNYLQTMNLRLKQGRFFNEKIQSDKVESVIINEAFGRKMGWKDPLSKSFNFDNVKWHVIGVVEDFHYRPFYYQVEPVMIHIGPEDKYRYLAINAAAGHVNEVADFMKKSWASIAPDEPYEGHYQNEVFEQFFRSNRSNNRIMYFLAGVSLMLACMGLYGLISYNLTRRLKEFSIRRVFGANLLQIFRLMNRDYLWIVVVSFCAGAPIGFYLMELLIKASYPEVIPVNAWPFLVTIGIMTITVAVTIATQLKKVAAENPAKTLRND